MEHEVDTSLYLDAVSALLDEGRRRIPIPVAGTSMTPFLMPGDTVYVSRAAVCRGDIVLFRRADGRYVLHRLSEAGNTLCRVCGDAQQTPEYIDADCILARVEAVRRRGKLLDCSSLCWRLYAGPWQWLRPIRPQLLAIYRRFRSTKGG